MKTGDRFSEMGSARRLLLALCFLCTLVAAVPFVVGTEAVFDLGYVNFPDPIIYVEYSEPVDIHGDISTLLHLDSTTEVYLDYDPEDGLSQTFDIIPRSELDLGNYDLVLSAQDAEANTVIASATFTVTGLQIELDQPPNGISPVGPPYDVSIKTGVLNQDDNFLPLAATCKYRLGALHDDEVFDLNPSKYPNQFSPAYPTTGETHTTSLTAENTHFSVYCQDYKEGTTDVVHRVAKQFEVGYDTTPPRLNITVNPEFVQDPRSPHAGVVVSSYDDEPTNPGDKVYCTISTVKPGGSETVPFSGFLGSGPDDYEHYDTELGHVVYFDRDDGVNRLVNDMEHHIFTYTVVCGNVAGRSTSRQVSIEVDFETPLDITVTSPVSSPTCADPFFLNVTTNIPATCLYEGVEMTAGRDKEYFVELNVNPNQNYSVAVNCSTVNKKAGTIVEFTTDCLPPTNVEINASEEVCGMGVTADITAEDNFGVRGYYWRLLDASSNEIESGFSINGNIAVTVPGLSGEQTVTWEAEAEDYAGNRQAATPVTVTVLAADTDECQGLVAPNCPNGVVDYADGEQCDGSIPAGVSCTNFDNFAGGSLACTLCMFDTNTCELPAPDCGNGYLEPGEECDGALAAGTSCTLLGYAGGTLNCTSQCLFDVSACTGIPAGVCGDGSLSAGETCDVNTTSFPSCQELGFGPGTVNCTVGCHFDTTQCSYVQKCNDGFIQPGEQCDGTNFGVVQTCADIVPTFTGTPRCDPVTCMFDLTVCSGFKKNVTPTPSDCTLTCAADGYCENACSIDPECAPDPDCGPGGCLLSCDEDGVCNEDCALDSNCFSDPDCGPGPTPGTCSHSCYEDGECVEECALDDDCLSDPDCEKGLNWLALILIVLGLLMIGGCSYYLYYAYGQRRERQRAAQAAAARSAGRARPAAQLGRRLSPEERKKMLAALQRRRQEELESFKKHQEQRSTARHSIVSAFESGKPPGERTADGASDTSGSASAPDAAPSQSSAPSSATRSAARSAATAFSPAMGPSQRTTGAAAQSSGQDADEGDYVSLDDLAKSPEERKKKAREASQRPAQQAQSAQAKKNAPEETKQESKKESKIESEIESKKEDDEDAFDDLDDLIGE